MNNIEELDKLRLKRKQYIFDKIANINGLTTLHESDYPVTRCLGYHLSFRYDGTYFNGMDNLTFTNKLYDAGFPFFKGHNAPMYEREPFKSKPRLYRKLDCPIAENYAKRNIVNIRHEILMADEKVIDELIQCIRELQN